MARTIRRALPLVTGISFIICFGQCQSLDDHINGLSSDDEAVRQSALHEKADFGASAVKPLVALMAGDDHAKATTARAALEALAHDASAPGKNSERANVAAALLEEVSGPWPVKTRRRLLRLVSFTGGDGEAPELARLIRSDPETGEMAAWALSRIPGEASLIAMRSALPVAPAGTKPALINALAGRGDIESADMITSLARDKDRSVREAAIDGLGKIAVSKSASVLRQIMVLGPGESSTRAEHAYLELAETFLKTGKRDIAQAMFNEMFERRTARAHLRCAGLWGLVNVKGKEAVSFLEKVILENGYTEITGSAVGALASIQGEKSTLALAKAAAETSGRTRAHLIHALGARNDRAARAATKTIIEAMKKAPSEEKVLILNALGEREDRSLAGCFLDETHDSSEDVVVAALEALEPLQVSEQGNMARLVQLGREGRPEEKAAALSAYIRIGEGMAAVAKDKNRARLILLESLDMAEQDSLKTRAIAGLGETGGPLAITALRKYLRDENNGLKKAATRALAPLAVELARSGQNEEGAALLKEVVKLGNDPKAVQDAANKLEKELGIEVDVPVRKGCLSRFWLLGPFSGRDELITNDPVPVDSPVDLEETVEHKGESYDWRYHRLKQVEGKLDLVQVVEQKENCGIYAYAEVRCEKAVDGCFKIGSDDDVFCWLNRELVHSWEGGRGWSADADSVDVHLKAGWNTILLKVLNGGGDWAVSLRITDVNGSSLVIEQKER